MQTRVPCIPMRGGTSKGPFFLASDLPADPKLRDEVLIAALGSPHEYQVDGVGGVNPLSSKVAIIAKSQHPAADVNKIEVDLDVELNGKEAVVRRAALIRTARRLFQGDVLIPSRVWAQGAGAQRAGSDARSRAAA